MRGKITLRTVAALKPGAILWDERTTGFAVRRLPSGKTVYVLKYRAGGRQRWYTIGQHGAPWTPDGARGEAVRLLGQVESGADPAGERERGRAAASVAELGERFLAEHAAAKLKPRTVAEYRRLVGRVIVPALGRLRVADLTHADVAQWHHGRRATPCDANRGVALLSKMMNWAERHGERQPGANPCRGVERFREGKRERFLSAEELARLAGSIDAEADPFIRAAVRLLVFTGARLGEILSLRWEYVDFERACLRLPDSKTGAKTVPLNAPALDVLAALPRIDGNPHVIVGAKAGAALVNLEKPWRRIRARAGLADVRLHDLRHSFASFGAAGGLSLPMIGRMLGHASAATTARYAHLADDPVRAAAEAVGQRIAAAMQGDAAKIVRLHRASS